MTTRIIQVGFVICCAVMGASWADYILQTLYTDATVPYTSNTLLLWRGGGVAIGVLAAIGVLFGLKLVTQRLFERLFPVVIAIAFSLMMGYFLARIIMMALPFDNPEDLTPHVFLTSTLMLIFGYVGISLGLTKASSWESLVSAVKKSRIEFGNPKIVDTSVIIDGRIADIVKTGFIEGTLIVPRFVLKELQNIADSADVLRRAKGRRGLDILKMMQEEISNLDVEITDDDPMEIKEVDGKLVALARDYKAKIITNDFNLNKVAQIEGIQVLNINDLANALKPAVLPDERIEVKIVKEGKEAYQGVGYLDDGTMIVVDGGRDYVGKQVSVLVTSVLQTAAGRMIFTKLGSLPS